jgi:hypothetical protein
MSSNPYHVLLSGPTGGLSGPTGNINTALHKVVVSDKTFLFTKRHLKHLLKSNYFDNEDSTYFSVSRRRQYINVLEVNGNECNEYENMDAITIDNLIHNRSDYFKCHSKATKMLIIKTTWIETQKTDMSIYWTDAEILVNAADASQYSHSIHVTVDDAVFEEFKSWLKKSVPGVVVVTDTVMKF